MRTHSLLIFAAKAAIVGLAAAFVITQWWPQFARDSAPVEIREVAPSETLPPLRTVEGPYSYAAAVERAAPAVVNINTAKLVTVRRNPFFDDPIFRQFFGRDFDEFGQPRQRVETSLGSGVIMSDKGYILTNNHVIQGADAIQVWLRDGRTAEAAIVGVDPDTDLAVLKISLGKLPSITLGNSERVRVGDVALAIGNPFGVGQTVTMGIVSATGRNKVGINTFENFIQTDAAINPGNSGGALIDAQGNLIGINTAILSRTGGYQGIGWAIPMSIAKGVLEDIIQHGRPLRGWLGFGAQPVTPELARTFNLDTPEGLIVTGVVRNGPAHKAGLQPGDVITEIGGKKVNDAREALIAISNHRPGAVVTLTVIREGKTVTLRATAVERPQGPPVGG